MGSTVSLKAADGHELDAYLAPARGRERGAVVVIQEIFGVNSHIKKVTDQYAEQGYRAIAPALFDRLGAGGKDFSAILQLLRGQTPQP